MPINLTVSGQVYAFPTDGDSSGWGQVVTDWAEAITDLITTIKGAYDIEGSGITIDDSITSSSPASITGLSFSSSNVRSAVVEYFVYRTNTDLPTHVLDAEVIQSGFLLINYKSTAGTFDINSVSIGDAGIVFSINASGQVQYYITNHINAGGGVYTGTMTFKARALPQ